jgi:hypothetical protein
VHCLLRSLRGGSTPCAWTFVNQWAPLVTHVTTLHRHVGQISPNKNMSLQCATAAFTLSAGPGGLRHLVLTRPQTEPSMRFLFVGSHLCARASFRQALAGLPLPSASSYPDSIGSSYRGLSPHKLMPMSGVHCKLERTRGKRSSITNAHRGAPLNTTLNQVPRGLAHSVPACWIVWRRNADRGRLTGFTFDCLILYQTKSNAVPRSRLWSSSHFNYLG